jgi:hypothetical protein
MLSAESANESNNLKIKSNEKENLKDLRDPHAGADGISIGSGTGA